MSSRVNSITGTGSICDLIMMDDGAQTAGLVEVALADVAVDHHGAVFADAGQKGLDLGRRGVLRLVEQHKGVLPRPAAHDLERHQLDVAPLQRDLVGGLADPLLDRLRPPATAQGANLSSSVPGK